MRIGIHLDRADGMTPFSVKYEEILAHNGIESVRLDVAEPSFWEEIAKVDRFIYHWTHDDYNKQKAPSILPVVEMCLKIECFPNLETCWHYDDKIKQYHILRSRGFPVAKTWVFWDQHRALDWLTDAPLPLVFKLSGGAGSSNVIFVGDRERALLIVRRMFGRGVISGRLPFNTRFVKRQFGALRAVRRYVAALLQDFGVRAARASRWNRHKNYALFQEFLPGNSYDTRVVVIGPRAMALRRLNRKGDFRASGSGLLRYDPTEIDHRFIELAFKVSAEFGFQSMAYDFLYDENRDPVIAEISYTFPYGRFLLDCPGYWTESLDWVRGHHWPQYFQLVDLLGLPDLRHPADLEL